jgi:hypothetical protein
MQMKYKNKGSINLDDVGGWVVNYRIRWDPHLG